MKKYIKIISLALALMLLMSCTALYDKLSNEYGGVNLQTLPKTTTTTTTASTTSTTVGNDQTNSTTTSKNDENAPSIDFSAPDFTVLDANGNKVKLSSFAGKPIVVNFWATWCGYCKQEMADFQIAYEKYPNVQFVMVNATDGVYETLDSAKSYIAKNNFTFPVFFDTTESAVKAYEVDAFPITFFINAEGEVVAYGRGMLTLATLEQGIEMITANAE